MIKISIKTATSFSTNGFFQNAALCTEYAALRDTAWDVNFQFLRSDAHFMIYGKDDPSQVES